MKTFQSKNLIPTQHPVVAGALPFFKGQRMVSRIKGLTLFFLGASIVVLATYAVQIDPGIGNLTQYIQKIVVTSDGTVSGSPVVTMNSGNALEVKGNGNFNGDVIVTNVNGAHLTLSGGESLLGPLISFSNQFGGSASIGLLFGHTLIIGNSYTGSSIYLMTNSGAINLVASGIQLHMSDGVGIGTESPAYTLDVNGTGNFSNGLIVSGGLQVDGTTLSVDEVNDRVGIGTSTPTAKLDVDGTGKFSNGLLVSGSVDLPVGQSYWIGPMLTNFSTNELYLRMHLDDITRSAYIDHGGTGALYIRGGGNVGNTGYDNEVVLQSYSSDIRGSSNTIRFVSPYVTDVGFDNNKNFAINHYLSNQSNRSFIEFRSLNDDLSMKFHDILSIYHDNKVSIGGGDNNPQATLDVRGGVKVGNDTGSCDSNKQGTIRFDGIDLQVCIGSHWYDIETD